MDKKRLLDRNGSMMGTPPEIYKDEMKYGNEKNETKLSNENKKLTETKLNFNENEQKNINYERLKYNFFFENGVDGGIENNFKNVQNNFKNLESNFIDRSDEDINDSEYLNARPYNIKESYKNINENYLNNGEESQMNSFINDSDYLNERPVGNKKFVNDSDYLNERPVGNKKFVNNSDYLNERPVGGKFFNENVIMDRYNTDNINYNSDYYKMGNNFDKRYLYSQYENEIYKDRELFDKRNIEYNSLLDKKFEYNPLLDKKFEYNSILEKESHLFKENYFDSEQPIFVNVNQFNCIKKRKIRRDFLDSIMETKTGYLHESRHRHAMNRLRAPSGRFLTKEEMMELKKKENKQ